MTELNPSEKEELYDFFRENFPLIVREEETARRLLYNEDNILLAERDEDGRLYAACLIYKDTVYMLAVEASRRNQGIGSRLLTEAENVIREAGYQKARVGAGESYLMPGVPTSDPFFPEKLSKARLYSRADRHAADFFLKRGWKHAWQDCDCFDMRTPLIFPVTEDRIGCGIGGVTYRWATRIDMPQIKLCTDDAEEGFSKYYQNKDLYMPDSPQRVLAAEKDGEIIGVLMVSYETEAKGLGSVGCTAVKSAHRGHHVAVNLVKLGTEALRLAGIRQAYLGYTYTGLDRLYGYAGYEICLYYMMAEKAF